MILTTLLVIFVTTGIGAAAFTLYHFKIKRVRTVFWFALSAALIIAPLCSYIGWQMGKASKLSFSEFWNGWEVGTTKEEVICHRDGACRYEYDCDPYLVEVCNSCNCDSKGRCSRCCHMETRYHNCPYVDAEYNYDVQTTVGNFSIDRHRFPNDPQRHRWREGVHVPDGIIHNAGVGDPKFWTDVKNRIFYHLPGPVSVEKQYDNYLYASERTILKQYSGNIQSFKAKKLLPSIEQDVIYDFYHSNKVYQINLSLLNYETWKERLEYFNADLGTKLQGDLYLVVADEKKIEDPYAYTLSLKAYWQDTDKFRKRALSKNAVVVIIGTDGKRVVWANTFTGMPMGNDLMMNRIKEMAGRDLVPDAVFGMLRDIMFGQSDPSTKFKRVSMRAKDKGDIGSGYLYLDDEIAPTDQFQMWIMIISMILCCIPWAVSLTIAHCED